MSFGFGIGDAIAITELIVKTYNAYKGAPKEVLQIGKDARGTGARLASLGKTIEQPTSLIHTKDEGMHVIQVKKLLSQTITELKSDLASVKDLIREWNSICETGSVAQRMRFTMVDVGKLKDLNLKLRNHDSRIDSILQTLQSAANDHISEQNKKLQQQLEDMNRIIKKIERQTRKRQKWEEVVTQHGVAAVSQAACDQDEKPWLLIKKDLVKKGLSEEEADEILKPIRSELSELPAPEPVLHSPDPKTPPERMTSPVIIPIHPKKPPKVKEPDLAPPSPLPEANPPNGSSQESVTIRATTKRKAQVIDVNRSRILFADESNTRRSIVAQAYLELARIWTMNTTNRWLFEEVGSAGTHVESPFTLRYKDKLKYSNKFKPPTELSKNECLQALIDQNTFRSNERSMVVERLRGRQTQGVHPEHFYKWDYIICFGKDTHESLETLQACAETEYQGSGAPKAKIVKLGGARWTLEGQELVNAVKKTIKTWLKEELKWVEPAPSLDLRSSLRRTYQIVTTEEHFRTMMGEDWSQGFWVIRKECAVFLSCTPWSWENTRLITCSGKREELDKAWAMLKDKGIVEIAKD